MRIWTKNLQILPLQLLMCQQKVNYFFWSVWILIMVKNLQSLERMYSLTEIKLCEYWKQWQEVQWGKNLQEKLNLEPLDKENPKTQPCNHSCLWARSNTNYDWYPNGQLEEQRQPEQRNGFILLLSFNFHWNFILRQWEIRFWDPASCSHVLFFQLCTFSSFPQTKILSFFPKFCAD